MKRENELHTIEFNFDIRKASVNAISAWPLLRQRVYFGIVNQKLQFNNKLRTRNIFQLFNNALFGWRNLFRLRSFDYLFFNNADKRTLLVDNKYYDVFFDSWADEIGQDKSLFIEWASQSHLSKDLTYSTSVISDVFVKLGIWFYSLFTIVKVSNIEPIESILKEYNLNFNIKKHLKNKYGEIKFYRFLFKWIKPKSIFLISSFTKVSLVVAAHLENIQVIEVQHGYIGNNHQFYNAYAKFGKEFYPDVLIAFGNQEKRNASSNFIFSPEQIFPVGSLYLENVKNSFVDEYLSVLQSKYEHLFCVTLQTVKEIELLQWVTKQALSHEDWLFIIKPRNVDHLDYNRWIKTENMILLPQYNIYQVLKYSNYNITIYSTTAVEASYFNVKTLFYNIDGLSEKYYGDNKMFTAFINSENDISQNNLEMEDSNSINYFVSGYRQNIKKAKYDI